MSSVTIGAGCTWTSEHLTASSHHIGNLDVKTFGSVSIITPNIAMTTLNGTTLTVRSGAEVGVVVWDWVTQIQ